MPPVQQGPPALVEPARQAPQVLAAQQVQRARRGLQVLLALARQAQWVRQVLLAAQGSPVLLVPRVRLVLLALPGLRARQATQVLQDPLVPQVRQVQRGLKGLKVTPVLPEA